jgi:hydrogenase nickel incorporation protein HypA/HybF
MHELSVSSAIVDTAVRHAAGRPVTVVTVRIGHLRQVVPDSLAFFFDLVSRETVCEGARLEQVVVTARLRCGSCAREWDPEDALFRCVCGAAGEVIAGDELEVESIEVEEAACTA